MRRLAPRANLVVQGGGAMPDKRDRRLEGIIARLAILEGICGAALGLGLASMRNDVDYPTSPSLIAALRQEALNGVADFPEQTRKQAELYLDSILRQVTKSLALLRGEESGKPH
jgi:hypothetical protein